ncbi:TPA: DUF1385 domain-containing protein [Candidatus Woesearchaeota archaeon]|nr:MAG: hypothetical protein QT04_C0019G0002 [archaeon GW2011_AR11]HIH04765.1 DUF1385 domain-containing protein [Candidatus Woesearchaeota archaeon]HIH92117.1 DUF1385 domain-containing protein [Candidatus Woesearchaeota archaeon]HII65017.1 DUF1385 domain-containing protein [Candidatus Woesearchaeota archaeon]
MKDREKHIPIGGQAVIEGVMILAPTKYAITVRKPDKSVKTKVTKLRSPHSRLKKLPFVRGSVNLVRMLSIGMKALTWSANQAAAKKDEKLSAKEMTGTILFSILLAIGIFVALPYVLTHWIGFREESKPFLFNLIDGIIRIAFFVAYIWAISFMKDIRRMFQYHGAEHMAIHCYEHKRKLTAKNVAKFTTLHPRCGTAFILLVLLVSILVFSVIPSLVISLFPGFTSLGFWTRKLVLFVARLLFIPVVAGVSYELLKASDRHKGNVLWRMVSAPGLWLQKITTQKPSKDQIEVAIASVRAALRK